MIPSMATGSPTPAFRRRFGVLLLAGALVAPLSEALAESYAAVIRQHVVEDKVYLLQSLRQKVTLPAERLVLEGLLSEDAPKAMELFRRQLLQYPDAELNAISTQRIESYNVALSSMAPLPTHSKPLPTRMPPMVASAPKPAPVAAKPAAPARPVEASTPKPAAPAAPADVSPLPALASIKPEPAPVREGFLLQFGSFQSRENAERLASKMAPYGQAGVFLVGGMHKVRMNRLFASHEEAEQVAKSLPFGSVIITLTP